LWLPSDVAIKNLQLKICPYDYVGSNVESLEIKVLKDRDREVTPNELLNLFAYVCKMGFKLMWKVFWKLCE